MLILGTTTQRSVLQQLDLASCFDRELAVPNVNTHSELANICREVKAFDSEQELMQSLNMLRETTGGEEVGVGIKRILLGIETARQSERGQRAEMFADVVARMIASAK